MSSDRYPKNDNDPSTIDNEAKSEKIIVIRAKNEKLIDLQKFIEKNLLKQAKNFFRRL